jgi:hypothetical protein
MKGWTILLSDNRSAVRSGNTLRELPVFWLLVSLMSICLSMYTWFRHTRQRLLKDEPRDQHNVAG